MPLVPHPDRTTPETILSFGLYGSGKTEDWISVADQYRVYGNEGQFSVLSTEYERVLSSMEGRKGWRDNITLYEVDDFKSLVLASEQILEKTLARNAERGVSPLDSDDWIVVDVIGPPLRWARDVWFTKSGRAGSYREFQEEGGTSGEVQASDWQQMDTIYLSWFNPSVARFPANRFLVSQAEGIPTGQWAPKETSTVKRVFGRQGSKAVGHKELGALAHTVIYKDNPATGVYEFTNIKDKPNREKVAHQPVMDPALGGFTVSYLMGIAGWSVQ